MDYWNFVKSQIKTDDNLFAFGRTTEVQNRYDRFKSNISNIFEYLIESLFPNNEEMTFRENDFPYNFDTNEKILHYLIWINPKKQDKIDKQKITHFLNVNKSKLEINIKDYIMFENNPINKSVKTIEHYHILFRVE